MMIDSIEDSNSLNLLESASKFSRKVDSCARNEHNPFDELVLGYTPLGNVIGQCTGCEATYERHPTQDEIIAYELSFMSEKL